MIHAQIQETIELLERTGDVKAAGQKFQELLARGARGTDAAAAHVGLARIQLAAGELDKADASLTNALLADPGFGEACSYQGLVLFRRNDPEAALSAMQRAVQLSPDSFRAHYNLATSLMANNRPRDAVPAYVRAIELQPDAYRPHYELAVCLLTLGEAEAAERAVPELVAAIRLDPTAVDPLILSAQVNIGAEDYDVAHELLERALQLEPTNLRILVLLNSVCRAKLDLPGALQVTESMAKLLPNEPGLQYDLSMLYLATSNGEAAERTATQLVQVDPKDWRGHFLLGMIYAASKRRVQALKSYEESVRVAPTEWKTYNNLGELLIEEDDPKLVRQGLGHLESALRLQPNEVQILYNLALANAKLNQKAQAIEVARKVVATAGADPELSRQASKLVSALGG